MPCALMLSLLRDVEMPHHAQMICCDSDATLMPMPPAFLIYFAARNMMLMRFRHYLMFD